MKSSLHFPYLLFAMSFVPIYPVYCKNPTKSYTSYRSNPFCNPCDYMRYPKNADEVVAIVNEAINRGVKVKAFGARHSQTDIICTDGIPVDMTKLKSFYMNADNVTATFGSGVTVRQAGEFLFKHRRSLRNTPAFGNITLGGAIGTGAHGSTIKYASTVSEQVVGMTVVDGLGQKVVISDPDDLKALKVHLGLLGIIVDITLTTVPLYKVLAHNYVVPDDILTNGVALNWVETSDQITFYWFPAFSIVVVANLTFVRVDTTGNALSNAISPPTYGSFNFIFARAKEVVDKLSTSDCTAASSLGNKIARIAEFITVATLWDQVPDMIPIYTEDTIFLKNPAVGFPHLMFGPVCSEEDAGFAGVACFWAHGDINSNITILDNEFGISLSNLSDFVKDTKDIVRKTPTAFPLTGIFIRFSGKSDIFMSTAYQRDTAHIEFAHWKRKRPYDDASGSLAGYQTIAQTLAKRFNARSHWGKNGFVYHSSEMLDLKLDTVARRKFVAAMNKFDPNGIFLNSFGRRITKTGTKIDSDPLTTRCALLDNCFCSKNADCAVTQICTSLSGYSYKVCKTKNELPEIQFSINDLPSLNHALDWLDVAVPILAKTVLTRCSLLDIIGKILG